MDKIDFDKLGQESDPNKVTQIVSSALGISDTDFIKQLCN